MAGRNSRTNLSKAAGFVRRARLAAIVLSGCLPGLVAGASAQSPAGDDGVRYFVVPGVPAVRGQPKPPKARALQPGPKRFKVIQPDFTPDQPLLIDSTGKKGKEDTANWLTTVLLADVDLRCTGTVIGPRVLLTAAHCVVGRGNLGLRIGERRIALACDVHPKYHPRGRGIYYDYALCYLAEAFPRRIALLAPVTKEQVLKASKRRHISYPGGCLIREAVLPKFERPADNLRILVSSVGAKLTGKCENGALNRNQLNNLLNNLAGITDIWRQVEVRFERLSIARRDGRRRIAHRNSRPILMAGYGCTERDGSGGDDGAVRAGQGKISRVGKYWLTVGTRQRADSAIVCQGDSGGPAFRLFSDNPYGPRRIIAINAYNLEIAGRIQNRSFLVKTTSRSFIRFFKRWRRRWGRPLVCGIDRGLDDICHS